jgi:hypothetical protein
MNEAGSFCPIGAGWLIRQQHLLRICPTSLCDMQWVSAPTVNQRLAALRGTARHHGRPMRIPDVKQTPSPIATLNGHEIVHLLAAVNGPH